jgi:phosphate transport system substrate-binding protein
VERWSDVRDGWPDRELSLFGPGTASGTFDYFTEAIMGEEDASRSDYSSSEDDNVILMGVGNNVGAMGYFGFAYYVENQDRVKALAVDDGDGCVEPTRENVEAGDYQPLSRPLYIYVKRSSYRDEPVVREFVDFYLESATELVPQVGYVAFPRARYDSIRAELGGDDAGTEEGSGTGEGGA